MHIPDGFLSPPVWGAFDVLAVPAAGWMARGSRDAVEDRNLPLLGVMGAFVFAAQMINFPVGLGTSGHLVGGTLLAIVLGPAAATMVMASIIAIQALVFQDGGILALGANVFNMAVAGVIAGYLPFRSLRRHWPSGAVFIGGTLSVLTSACLALAELFASGMKMPRQVFLVSVGLFVVSALIEGAITLAAVRAIGRMNAAWVEGAKRPARLAGTVAVAAVVLAVAGILVASTDPDGIEKLAEAKSPVWLHSPLADYQIAGIDSPWLRRAGAGVAGLVLIYLVSLPAGKFLRRKKAPGREAFSDQWSLGSSPLHALDARAKLCALLIFLIAVSSTPGTSQIIFAFDAALLIGAVAIARLPLVVILKRLALMAPFVATFALITWAAGQPERALAIFERSGLSGFAAIVLVATTPIHELLRGLEWLRIPRQFILITQFLYRYLFVIREQAQHMRMAAKARGSRFHSAAGAAGVLFARSWESADGIYQAMLARGFTGKFRALQAARFRLADAAFLFLTGAIVVGARLIL